jgi:hypothetical protein
VAFLALLWLCWSHSRVARYVIAATLLSPLFVVAGRAVPKGVTGKVVAPEAVVSVPACWTGPAVVRGNRWLLGSGYASQPARRSFTYGLPGDHPFFRHWGARSVSSAPGVVRGGRTWLLRRSQSGGPADITFTYGRTGDIPVVGDWDGDGIDTPGVVRGTTWYLRNHNSSGPAEVTFTFDAPGAPTSFPSFGGPTGVATFDAGTWYVRFQHTTGPPELSKGWGHAGDIPIEPGYHIGNPDCTSPGLAVVRGNVWHITGGTPFGFGRVGDLFLTQHSG